MCCAARGHALAIWHRSAPPRSLSALRASPLIGQMRSAPRNNLFTSTLKIIFSASQAVIRTDGRVVEGTGLENRHTVLPYRGFESLSVRQSSVSLLLKPAINLCCAARGHALAVFISSLHPPSLRSGSARSKNSLRPAQPNQPLSHAILLKSTPIFFISHRGEIDRKWLTALIKSLVRASTSFCVVKRPNPNRIAECA